MNTTNHPAQPQRLGAFIRAHLGAVVSEWETFARTLDVSRRMSPVDLRDHCAEMLLVVADAMDVDESDHTREAKSKGQADVVDPLETAATTHGALRQLSGFDLVQLVSEFRALRASVLALWHRSEGAAVAQMALEDHIRFNEAIDRALAESVKSYAASVASSRDMFLAILGHDLRGPLSCISMSALSLGMTGLTEEPRQRAASRIRRAASEMSHLITDLMEFTQSRLGGGMPIKRMGCDLGLLCAETLDSVRTSHPGQVFLFQASGNLSGLVDADRVRQMLSNLLHNAVQHGEPQAAVTLRLQADGDELQLQVCNSGQHIARSALPAIFEPMVRSPECGVLRGDGRSKSSLGLGLFIVREIVKGHEGTITVSSDVGTGTVFTIRLPRGAVQQEDPVPMERRAPQTAAPVLSRRAATAPASLSRQV